MGWLIGMQVKQMTSLPTHRGDDREAEKRLSQSIYNSGGTAFDCAVNCRSFPRLDNTKEAHQVAQDADLSEINMMKVYSKLTFWGSAITQTAALLFFAFHAHAEDSVIRVVDATVKPVMAEHDIPGMSVGILVNGEKHILHYGVASRQTQAPVSDQTIFEIGSLSKPFTGTLGGVLQANGSVDLAAKAESLMSDLEGSPIGDVSLMQLATYNAGGLPLQFPEHINDSNFLEWFRNFKVNATAGESRLYSNPSIGLFGHLLPKAAGGSFEELLHEKVLQPLELRNTFLTVPSDRTADYAQGYTQTGTPVRVNPGVFDDEAYGVKTTAADLLRFVEASATARTGNPKLDQGLRISRHGYYRVNTMHQGLGWELYPAPASLRDLLQGVDPKFVLEQNLAEAVPSPVVDPHLVGTVSKTGSTAGFGAYALFSPERGVAIVMLANRFWPNSARVKAAHTILSQLDPEFAEP